MTSSRRNHVLNARSTSFIHVPIYSSCLQVPSFAVYYPCIQCLTPISTTSAITATIEPICKLKDAINNYHQKAHIAVDNVSTFRCAEGRLRRWDNSFLGSTKRAWLIRQRHSTSDCMFLVAEEPGHHGVHSACGPNHWVMTCCRKNRASPKNK